MVAQWLVLHWAVWAAMHAQGGLPIPNIVHIRQPYWFGEGREHTADEFGLICARALADKIEELGKETIAGFIAEPVQGAGGVIVPPATYWPEVQKICDHYDIPIIADEVICGFGRLGQWFGSEHFNIQAKIMPIAKGLTSGYLPMGGVLVHDDISEVLTEKCGEFTHGYTYSGHPTCAAVALENIRIMRDENIIKRTREEIVPYFQRQWATLGAHPLVAEVRGVGMVAAIELNKDKNGNSIDALCRDLSLANGLVMRSINGAIITAPPLIISKEQVDELITIARKTLDDVAAS